MKINRKLRNYLEAMSVIMVVVFLLNYFLKKHTFLSSVIFALISGVIVPLFLLFAFNLPNLLSKIIELFNSVLNQKRIQKIRSYLQDQDPNLQVITVRNNLKFAVGSKNVIIKVGMSSIHVYYEFESEVKEFTSEKKTKESYLLEIIRHKKGLVLFLKKNIPEPELFRLVTYYVKENHVSPLS